jgi:flagellar motor switch protein FliG
MANPLLTKRQKIATLLASLGEEQTRQVLAQLEPAQAAALAHERAVLGEVPNGTRRAVLREFRTLVQREERAEVLDALPYGPRSTARPFLATVTPTRAAEVLASEPDAIVALALAALTPQVAAAIVSRLPVERRETVIDRLSHQAPPSDAVCTELDRAIRATAARHGAEAAADGEAALTALWPAAPQEAHTAPAPVVVPRAFDALADLPRAELQALLRGVSLDDLALALRGAEPAVTDAVLHALPFSRRLHTLLRLRRRAAVRVGDILEAQARLAAALPVALEPVYA